MMPDTQINGASNSSMPQSTRKKRLVYLDIIRAFATVLIVITHFNNPNLQDKPLLTNTPFNIYIGDLGVSLFLIISGAALMYVYGDAETLRIKHFYFKRFQSIYPMYWIAFLISSTFYAITSGFFSSGTPLWRLIFSVVGVDGLLSTAQVQTFYLLGEWFLGFIIIFYIVFPLLREGVNKHPAMTWLLVLSLYAITLLLPLPPSIQRSVLLTTRLPELVFGMYFVKYIGKVSGKVFLGSIGLLVLQQITGFLSSPQFDTSQDLSTSLVGIASFLCVVWFIETLHISSENRAISLISKYSYPIFLVHHIVIIEFFNHFGPPPTSRLGSYILFTLLFCVIFALAFLLKIITDCVEKSISKPGKRLLIHANSGKAATDSLL